MSAPADVVVFTPRPRPPQRARRRPKWVTRAFQVLIGLVIMAVIGTGVGYVYLRVQLGKIKRVDIPTLSDDVPGDVMNVLLVGSDSRANVDASLADATGKEVEGDRQGLSDTMMVLHIDPKAEQAAILSIPRDLYVKIPGENGRDRINSAFAVGGPQLLIQTIQEALGIQVNHYAEVDFEGFKNIVDTVGGLNVYLDAPARDKQTGLDQPNAGCVKLDGFQALAYVRSRYYESYEAGRWVPDPTSDIGRIQRQQDFIRRMMKKAVSSGLGNPLTLNRLIGIGVNNLTIDSSMSTKDIVTVARRFKSLDPNKVDMQTLPTTDYTTPGGAEVLLVDDDAAQPLIDHINGKAPPEPSKIQPAEVQVRVLNGNGADGAASKAGAQLTSAGFTVSGTGDADAFTYRRTTIHYGPAGLPKAQLLQNYLVAGADVVEDRTLGTADIALVLGSDFAGLRSSPTADVPAGPSTTAPAQSPTPDAKGSTQRAC